MLKKLSKAIVIALILSFSWVGLASAAMTIDVTIHHNCDDGMCQ